MDHLKEGIGLRGYGQKDPKREYQREGFEMFLDMVYRIKEDTVQKLCMVQIQRESESPESRTQKDEDYVMSHGAGEAVKTPKKDGQKVGRNEPCPCGSGRKYKKCCGK
jgi:preprotein translocase subunit SecA